MPSSPKEEKFAICGADRRQFAAKCQCPQVQALRNVQGTAAMQKVATPLGCALNPAKHRHVLAVRGAISLAQFKLCCGRYLKRKMVWSSLPTDSKSKPHGGSQSVLLKHWKIVAAVGAVALVVLVLVSRRPVAFRECAG